MALFDGKVVAITGAGRGLGRAYALAFAREGARLVVNDWGASADGGGEPQAAVIEQVVAEIEALGGVAVPSSATVATEDGARSIVQAAVERFGRLDVLVNNAGILRDKSLVEMDLEQWSPVLDVHLRGTYLCTRHAVLQMVEQPAGGRIINTTSLAGMMGNPGQANYAAAKAGIVGLTRSAALELSRVGITVNAVAPLAKTRLTDRVAAIPDDLGAEQVAPLVLFLASDAARDITGRVFGMHGNHVFEYRLEMTAGVDKGADAWSVSEIAERLVEIGRSEADQLRLESQGVTPPADSTRALQLLEVVCGSVRSDKLARWTATLHFQITGERHCTLQVEAGRMTASPGRVGDPSCVIKMDAATFFGMAAGEVDGTQAFMQGKINATNVDDLVHWGRAFAQKPVQSALRQALASLPR